jgi:lipid-A-disaccharide synthase-like uncharacterized protein
MRHAHRPRPSAPRDVVSKTFHPWQVSGCANKSIFALHFVVAITTVFEI